MPPSSIAFSDLYEVSRASKERSSQNRMKRLPLVSRKCVRQRGSVPIYSRWISTSLSALAFDAVSRPTAGVHRLDEGAFPGAPGAPQKRVIGGKAARKAQGV